MGEIMNSPKGVKSGVPARMSNSCPTCGTRHDLPLDKDPSCVADNVTRATVTTESATYTLGYYNVVGE